MSPSPVSPTLGRLPGEYYVLHPTMYHYSFLSSLALCSRPASAPRYGMPDSLDRALDKANVALTAYFTVELAVRVAGIGPRR